MKNNQLGYCNTCANFIEFIDGCPAGRCEKWGITIVKQGKTKASECWWYPAERTSCAEWISKEKNK
jgi:hypothetical protein